MAAHEVHRATKRIASSPQVQLPKLIVTIPAYNEQATIEAVIREIPRTIDRVGSVEVIVLDDGSTDSTVAVAMLAGADSVISHRSNRGLAVTFRDALREALKRGADIIVNTDADNHYDQSRIGDLIKPILDNKADIAIGSRDISNLPMSWPNKFGNFLGSFLVRALTGLPSGLDASTGFRAYTRDAALGLNVASNHTYTHETLISAVEAGHTVVDVPLPARHVTRPSRLIKGITSHILRALRVIIRSYTIYQPFRVFMVVAAVFIIAGLFPMGRYAWLVFTVSRNGHVQSLLFGSVLLIVGFQVLVLSLLATTIAWNRKMIEEILYRQRRKDYEADE